MAKPIPPLTTEVYITSCNDTLAAILDNQYGRLESGEARAALEAIYPRVWNEDELRAEFDVSDEISSPYVVVTNRDTGKRGTMLRLDSPRFYFLFNPEFSDEPRQDV
jgi:hypothetical protein